MSEMIEAAVSVFLPDVTEAPRPASKAESRAAQEIGATTEGIRTLALRCSNLPAANKEALELGEKLREGAKNIMTGLNRDASECHQQLLSVLDESERRRISLALTISSGASRCTDLIRAVTDTEKRVDNVFDLTGRGAGSNVKFDSKCIKSELSRLSHVLSDFENTKGALSKFCDESYREAAMKAIQAASNQILSADVLGNVITVFKERQEYEKQQKHVEMKRGEKEAEVRLKEAEKQFLGVKLKEAKEEIQQIQGHLERKAHDLEQLQSTAPKKQELLAQCRAQKEQAEEQLRALLGKQSLDQAQARRSLDVCEEMIAELQMKLSNIDSFNINHIIIAVDNSGSMQGQRFKDAVRATTAFRTALVSRGSSDKISVVVFNSVANGCGGGTCFSKAWESIQECAAADPKFARVFVVFLSDGLAGSQDIKSAASKAEQIHHTLLGQKRSMCGFFVHIQDSSMFSVASASENVVRTSLEPLVQAANGGQTSLKIMDEQVPLLQLVKQQDLSSAFEKLTDMVNMQKCILEGKLAMLQKQQQQYKATSDQDIKDLQKRYKSKMASFKETIRAAEKLAQDDERAVQQTHKQLTKELELDISMLKDRLQKAQLFEHSLTKDLVDCESKHAALLKDFEVTQSQYEQERDKMTKMSQTQLSQLDKLHDKQKQLVECFGTSNQHFLTQQLEGLQRMKEQLNRSSLMEQDLLAMVESIVCFTTCLKDQLEEPLPGGTEKISKAKVALKQLLHQRGLHYKDVPQEDLQGLIKYEATMHGSDCDPEEVCNAITKAGITAEQICEAVDELDLQKVKEFKEDLVSILQSKMFEMNDCSTESKDAKIKSAKKVTQRKKEELKEKTEELRRSKSAKKRSVDADDEWELVENLEHKISDLQDELKDTEDELKELEEEVKAQKKSQQEICKQFRPTFRILELLVDICRVAFLEHIADEEKAALKSTFESFKQNVVDPMTEFHKATQKVRQDIAPNKNPTLLTSPLPTQHRKPLALTFSS
eukprot:CAMPEP_0181428434 /NCGR_PEP_ID=MMETSP1110-20121109/16677_1 /TAXON_ID=174948 /ORGANISM="Symbiodinium sp., Strain CCMP421" /LENGTH=999 /DNA_ID=CAMNT_0023551661 /DNA_START=57 /DNA_END=3056 /DNA_ORIENTATION=+